MGHIEAPIPENEAERLSALYQYRIVDTEAEKSFDDIVKLAAEICDTPIALISLVERERQWFKARIGLAAQETSRSVSFCAHAILGESPLVIEDATLDSRFSENPLVLSEPNIRFYAGVPLVTPTGQKLGSLCVIDNKSRHIDERQMLCLKVLASQVIAQLELRAQLENKAALEKELESSRNISLAIHRCVCVVEYDAQGVILSANQNFLSLLGYEQKEVIGKHDSIFLPYNERRSPSYAEFWKALRGDQCQFVETRRITKDNRDIWIRGSYTPVKDDAGNIIKIISFVFDVTKEKEAKYRNEQWIEAIDRLNAVVEFDLNGAILSANKNFLDIVGYTELELKGKPHSLFVPESERGSNEYLTFWGKLKDGGYFSEEFRRIAKDGSDRWIKGAYHTIYDMQGRPVRILKIALDTTAQKNLSIAQRETIEALNRSSAIIEFDLEGRVERVNDQYLRIIKYGREEVLGQNHSIFVSDEELESDAYRKFWSELRQGRPHIGEFCRYNKLGAEVWIRGAYNPIYDAHGKVQKIVKFAFDTTEAMRASRILSEKNAELIELNRRINASEAKYKALSDASPLGIYGTTADGDCTYVNDRYLHISGLSELECRGRGWLSAIHPHDRDRVEHEWYRAAAENREYESTHRFLRKDGTETWCSVKAAAVIEQDQILGYVGTMEDVTKRKTAEESLRLASSAGRVGVWHWDVKENSLTWDDSMLDIYGVKKSDFKGAYETWSNALSPEDRNDAERELLLAVKGEKDFDLVFRIVRPDGGRRFIKASAIIERDTDGDPLRMIGTNVDITELKATEENLRSTLADTAQKTRLLDFISSIQGQFIESSEPRELFDYILKGLLELADSEYGFIGEVLRSPEGNPYLKTHALTNIAWDDQTRALFEKYHKEGLEFRNLNTLFGAVMVTEEAVIANDPCNDKRAGGLPPGHPALNAFAGLPLFFKDELIGMIGLANRPGGYTEQFIQSLEAVLASCGSIVGAFRMTRSKKLADKQLEEYNARLEQVLKGGDLGSWEWNIKTGAVKFDDRWAQMLGYKLEELDGNVETWSRLVHPEDLPSVMQNLQDHLESKTDSYESEHRAKAKDGSWVWILDRGRVFERDTDGKPLRAAGTHLDITIRKSRDEELVRQKAMLSVFVENAPVAIAMFNKEMEYISASNAWSQEYRLGEQKILGRSHYEVFPNISDEWRSIHRRALGGEIVRCDKDTWRPEHWETDQTLRWEVKPWYLSPGIIGGIIMLTQDITEQCQREEELDRMRIHAEAATYAKSQFLANMSHEIRTPLTSIIGFAEAAKEDGVSSVERVKAFEAIFRNGKHLLGVINDILDYSKIDANALKIEMVPFSPVDLVENVRTLMLPRVAEKGLDFSINYKWELPRTITSDSLRLMQVLVNLVSNAIKFTEHGRVEITMECDREKEQLHFSIKDTGIGLTEEQISRLFQTFSQANPSTTRIYGGTGLGLSISKKLVEKLGGDIAVESVPAEGSTFSFFIKTGVLADTDWISSVPKTSVESDSAETVVRELNGKILIADDSEDNRNLMKFTLRKTGLDLTLVDNGGAALHKALSEHFDLILLDMQMPIMDGYTAAREMRRKGITVPIVAFTANAMKQDVINCIEAGCTTHLPKPFKKEVLFQCLYQQLRRKEFLSNSEDPIVSEKFIEDPDSLDIVLAFVEGLEKRIADLSKALAEGSFAKLEDNAHRLSGSAGLFGYSEISEIASQLEGSARRSQLAECKTLFANVVKAHVLIARGVEVMKNHIREDKATL